MHLQAHGEPPRARPAYGARSAPRSPIRISITPSWRRAWACTPRGRSPIRRSSAARCSGGRHREARRAGAGRRCVTRTVRGDHMRVGIVAAAAALVMLVAVAPARDVRRKMRADSRPAPHGDAESRPTGIPGGRLLGMPWHGGAGRDDRADRGWPIPSCLTQAVLQQLRVPRNAMPPYEATSRVGCRRGEYLCLAGIAAAAAVGSQHSVAELVIRPDEWARRGRSSSPAANCFGLFLHCGIGACRGFLLADAGRRAPSPSENQDNSLILL